MIEHICNGEIFILILQFMFSIVQQKKNWEIPQEVLHEIFTPNLKIILSCWTFKLSWNSFFRIQLLILSCYTIVKILQYNNLKNT